MNRVIKNYNKIVEALSLLTKQAEMLQKSIVPMTKMFEEIQKPLKAISDNAKITDNLTKALQRLIRTTKLNNLGIYSKDKTPEFEHRITGIKDFSPSDIYLFAPGFVYGIISACGILITAWKPRT